MPQTSQPFGATAYKHRTKASEPRSAHIASGYGTNIKIGDPIVKLGTGGNIARATAGARFDGFFGGCTFVNSDGEVVRGNWPANSVVQTGTLVDATYNDDPNQTWRMQADGSTSADIVGANCSFVFGTQTQDASTAMVDVGTASASALEVRVLGLADGSSWDDAYPDLEVEPNNIGSKITTGVA